MSKAAKSELVYVERMLEDIKMIRRYAADLSKRDFSKSPLVQDGIIRRIETLGEAAKRLSKESKSMCPDVPWADIAGMRDKLIHDYMGVDLDMVWEVANRDLKPLEKCLKMMKKHQ